VNTLGTTWLGMTVACAQCHDHKYDPVTQKDFYSLYAFFHNIPEKGKDGVRDRNPEPRLFVALPEQQKKVAQLNASAKELETSVAEMTKTLNTRQTEWERTLASQSQSERQKGHGSNSRSPLTAADE